MRNIKEKITAKSCPIAGEIEDRIRKGFNSIEIQLFPEHVESDTAVEQALKESLRDNISIPTVHAPLSRESRYQLIDCFTLKNEYYLNTMRFAQRVAEHYGSKVSVVFHTQLSIPMLRNMQGFYRDLVGELKESIKRFPMVTFSIENVTPTEDYRNDFCSGCFIENVELCRMFRKDVDPDYFFTTLDTCHAITTLKFVRELEEHGYRHDVCMLRHFFEQNADVCNNVHLAGVTDLGYYKGTHGIRMEKESGELRLCLQYIRKYIKDDTRITLEVAEKDYYDVKDAPAFRDDINFFR